METIAGEPPPATIHLADGTQVHGLNRNEADYLHQEIFVDRAYIPEHGFDLPTSPMVFDIGANIGLFTLFAVREWPGAAVHAFEPIPRIHEVLEHNVSVNSRVYTHRIAVSEFDGETRMFYYPNYTMMSGMRVDPERDRALVRDYAAGLVSSEYSELPPDESQAVLANVIRLIEHRFEPVEVPCHTARLPTVVKRLGIDRIDLLKIDVEGAELNVVHGLDEATWPKVRNAVVEVEDRAGELALIERLFGQHGMRTSTAQLDGYQGSDLHMLYAWR